MTLVQKLAAVRLPDETVQLLARPYTFLSERARQLGRGAFGTRLLLKPTTVLTGEQGVRLFYDTSRFRRAGAAPRRAQATLFGFGGVQSMDGEAHRVRKAMFMDLMTSDAVEHFADLVTARWKDRLQDWSRRDSVVLFDEVSEILCEAICRWVGAPLDAQEVPKVTDWMKAMIDAPAALGPRYVRGRLARKQAEAWAENLIDRVRGTENGTDTSSAVYKVSFHREADGSMLGRHTAAVELLNVIRPAVAIGRYLVFTAMALHSHPQEREQLRANPTEEAVGAFVTEVRRLYPFFPLQAAIASHKTEFEGEEIAAEQQVVIDLHGTNHDPERYPAPEEFRPGRWHGSEPTAHDMVPQGGGDYHTGHRCPGEWLTIAAMEAGLRMLVEHMSYTVPSQDLRMRPFRAPAQPNSRFIISNVRL